MSEGNLGDADVGDRNVGDRNVGDRTAHSRGASGEGAVSERNGGARSPAEERKIRRIVGSGTTLLRLLGRSWRMRRVDYGPVAELRRREQPIVFALWHGELFPLLWVHRDEGVSVLISEHRDGEIIARVAGRVGFATVRGSTSRGGGRALLGLTRVLRQGGDIAVTPDGPRGPALRYAPGALIAAQRARAPIVPVAIHVDRAWRFRSWDRFAVPWPFARLTVAYGAPTWVEAETMRDAVDEAERFTELHLAAMRRAAAAAAAGEGTPIP